MPETLLTFSSPIKAPDGAAYEARACGGAHEDGTWQGWIEFLPLTGGAPIRTPRETTQPNRAYMEYWATGLSPVYLEGALRRALEPPAPVSRPASRATMFDGPARTTSSTVPPPSSVLDPFSVYDKGEGLLRQELSALAAWHLVNIALEYKLTSMAPAELERVPASMLVDLIVGGVRERARQRQSAPSAR